MSYNNEMGINFIKRRIQNSKEFLTNFMSDVKKSMKLTLSYILIMLVQNNTICLSIIKATGRRMMTCFSHVLYKHLYCNIFCLLHHT